MKSAICSWCGKPNPEHEGGFERRDGKRAEGYFCDEPHYKKWLHAHAILEG